MRSSVKVCNANVDQQMWIKNGGDRRKEMIEATDRKNEPPPLSIYNVQRQSASQVQMSGQDVGGPGS